MLKIKEIREQKGFSQDEIVNLSGIKKRSYVDYENGKSDIPLSKLQKIATALNVSISILTGERKMLLSDKEKPVSGIEKTKECVKCKVFEKEIELLKVVIEAKDETIRAYQCNEKNNNNKEESKGRNSA